MKLLLINNEFPPIGGGGSTVTKYAIRYLVEAGYEVTLITSRFKELPTREVVEGGTVIRIPAVRRHKDFCSQWELIIFGLSALLYTLGYTLRHRVDFIQAYFAVPAGWVAWVISGLRRIPYGVYFGGSDIPGANPSRYKNIYPLLTPLLRAIWRRAEFRTVCSAELARLGRVADPSADFIVIPNGVQTNRFAPISRPINPRVKILFIGRLIPRKGFQRVVQALPRVKELTRQPFEVEVVGSGAARPDLDELAARLGVSELIHYVGTIPYEELQVAYQYADIFVLTSLSEGMPSVILEAMGCGLPIVASDVGGNNELVQEGHNGYLIRGDDLEKLAGDLARLISDEQLRRRFGQRSRENALKYDWREIMQQYTELYAHYDHNPTT
ncbi:MAG TPA: glycosyltransferase family 4 protein [Candidatus Andersenbacteria bacterium]|nr:glycosyltransferase family 4 protein [Candidatus Andersenbacteria bacterium]